jgi:hypothetical protein
MTNLCENSSKGTKNNKANMEKTQKETIIIGDVHGLTYWKEAIQDNPGCRYLFLGDYLDPYKKIDTKALLLNLQEIMQLKKDHPDDVILLLGNHDLHYFVDESLPCTRFNIALALTISKIFLENYHLFQFAYQEDKCLFTHAGVAHKWFVEDFKGDLTQNIAYQLNHPAPEQMEALFQCGFYRGGSANSIGGIFWADIEELHEPLQGYTQFVGHNRVPDILDHSHNGGRIVFCDCLFNHHYLKI